MSNRTFLTILGVYLAVGLAVWVWWVFWSGYGDPVGDSIWFAFVLVIIHTTHLIAERWARKHTDTDEV